MESIDHPIRDASLPAKRHIELLQLIRGRGQMTVHELSSYFEVSGDTIRRDLDLLAGQRLLTRTHGGAVAIENLVHRDSTFFQRMSTNTPAKKRMARVAARLIKDGETLLINGGSTTRFFSEELERKDLTIVTNNLSVPAALPSECVRDVYILGGQFKRDAQVSVGPIGFPNGVSIAVDTAVIGVGGVAIKEGLTTTVLEEASMISAMIDAARRTIILADSAKIGNRSFAHISGLDRIDILVTEMPLPADLAHALESAGAEVIIASES
jgi:DeoR/GlpR family transcriptional regulator of sugar metabolism